MNGNVIEPWARTSGKWVVHCNTTNGQFAPFYRRFPQLRQALRYAWTHRLAGYRVHIRRAP